jgi:hypothetical protein
MGSRSIITSLPPWWDEGSVHVVHSLVQLVTPWHLREPQIRQWRMVLGWHQFLQGDMKWLGVDPAPTRGTPVHAYTHRGKQILHTKVPSCINFGFISSL